jgi:hypothetical protein
VVAKKRRIVSKPTSQAAADWVAAGGIDPEIQQPDIQASKQPDIQTSKLLPKSKDPSYIRTTMYLPRSLHKRLSVASASDDVDMSDIAADAIAQWLDSRADV